MINANQLKLQPTDSVQDVIDKLDEAIQQIYKSSGSENNWLYFYYYMMQW